MLETFRCSGVRKDVRGKLISALLEATPQLFHAWLSRGRARHEFTAQVSGMGVTGGR